MDPNEAEQRCPICNSGGRYNPRYPDHVCKACLQGGVEVDGVLMALRELRTWDKGPVLCFVQGLRCVAREAYFGGTVVQPADEDGNPPPGRPQSR